MQAKKGLENRAKTGKERQFWKAVYNGCVAAK